MAGLPAALWLLGLFAAAPALRSARSYALADRLRDALILGVTIPFALGLVHLLYPLALWIALALCVAIAYARRRVAGPEPFGASSRVGAHYVLIAALVAVAWPQLMRPMLEGDSLSYHLPNAVAWVQAHSLWTTATRYWWYPPASELFAAALYATSGPFALPWCGVAALALLGFRIAAWAREVWALSPLLADALAAAAITAYPLAIQAGTLQNDVWLAAFFLESLWTMRAGGGAARTLAVTALIKPQGWLFAAIALASGRARRSLWLTAAGGLAIWIVHDALLWNHAIVAPATTEYGSFYASTILAHGLPALATALRVASIASPFAAFALLAALAAPLLAGRERSLRRAACAAAAVFVLLPFGYASSVAQLATGASLRLAAPAVAAGATILAGLARRTPRIAGLLLAASTFFGIAYVLAIFWNDAPTRAAPAIALVAAATLWSARSLRNAWPIAAGVVAVALAAELLAASHPVDFYADALRVNGRSTAFYSWIARERPTALGGVGLALGAVNVLSPQTRTVELPDEAPCAHAQNQRVLLAAVAEDGRTAAFNAARLSAARACGVTLYDDGIAVVSAPASSR